MRRADATATFLVNVIARESRRRGRRARSPPIRPPIALPATPGAGADDQPDERQRRCPTRAGRRPSAASPSSRRTGRRRSRAPPTRAPTAAPTTRRRAGPRPSSPAEPLRGSRRRRRRGRGPPHRCRRPGRERDVGRDGRCVADLSANRLVERLGLGPEQDRDDRGRDRTARAIDRADRVPRERDEDGADGERRSGTPCRGAGPSRATRTATRQGTASRRWAGTATRRSAAPIASPPSAAATADLALDLVGLGLGEVDVGAGEAEQGVLGRPPSWARRPAGGASPRPRGAARSSGASSGARVSGAGRSGSSGRPPEGWAGVGGTAA